MQLIILAISLMCTLNTEPSNPVSWSFELTSLGEDMYQMEATATIEKGWVLYSQSIPEDGPVPTEFEFAEGTQLVDEVLEKGEIIKEMDELFEMVISKYKKEVKFIQKFRSEGKPTLKGSVTWMTCDGLRCLPPTTKEFSL